MNIEIYWREKNSEDDWNKVEDLYFFEEKCIHDFEDAGAEGYEFKIIPKYVEYEEIIDILSNCPLTFIPALVIKIVEISYSRKVWAAIGKASEVIKKIEDQLRNKR